jgi:SAM-dependent methyltransferase
MGEQTAFDARGYWEQRLASHYTLGGVGYLGLGEGFNAWAYRVRRRVFLREVSALLPEPGVARVLDIGSGTGFYLDCWHELGAGRVTGSDLTDSAVGNLRASHPGDAIVRFDAGDKDLPFDGARFDAVSMMDVLYHVVDDARFRRAFANVHALLEPGGVFVFSENFLHRDPIRLPHQASRTLAEIEGVARDAGFQVVSRRPMFWLMNAPLDSESPLLPRWWAVLHRVASRRPRLGTAIAALLYPLELALVARRREGPSTELMICRRPVGDAPRRASSPRSEGA